MPSFDAFLDHDSWRTVDLSEYEALHKNLTAHWRTIEPDAASREGNSADLVYERKLYVGLASLPDVRTICEIGFNAGHSASTWLKANPTATVHMFDLMKHEYTRKMLDYIHERGDALGLVNAKQRLHLHEGESGVAVPAFYRQNPSAKCDREVGSCRLYEVPTAWSLETNFRIASWQLLLGSEHD
jgi:hypothetical protein